MPQLARATTVDGMIMGIFGDRDMKHLREHLEAGRMVLDMLEQGVRHGTPADTFGRIGDDLLADSRKLQASGRRDEAISELRSARIASEGDMAAMWNDLLRHVEQQLD